MNDDFRITLEAARVNAHMTQIEVCERIGVTQKTLINWEKGITLPTIDKAELISEVYGIPMNRINFCYRSSI